MLNQINKTRVIAQLDNRQYAFGDASRGDFFVCPPGTHCGAITSSPAANLAISGRLCDHSAARTFISARMGLTNQRDDASLR
jgi:hypothetical protein